MITFTTLYNVVWPEFLFVRRISLEDHLVPHLDILHIDVVDTEPGGVQLPQSQVREEGDVVLRVPVLTVQNLKILVLVIMR